MQLEPRPTLTLTLTRWACASLPCLPSPAGWACRSASSAACVRQATQGSNPGPAVFARDHRGPTRHGAPDRSPSYSHVWAPPWADETLGGPWAKADPFSGFIATLQYRFLPLLMLVFLLINAVTGRDFGPMLDEVRYPNPNPSPNLLEL